MLRNMAVDPRELFLEPSLELKESVGRDVLKQNMRHSFGAFMTIF
jgi:hypothetical protein